MRLPSSSNLHFVNLIQAKVTKSAPGQNGLLPWRNRLTLRNGCDMGRLNEDETLRIRRRDHSRAACYDVSAGRGLGRP
jgi:hypothetical protein